MAIYEQNYARYDGELQEGGGARVIAAATFRVFFNFLRTKILVGLCWIPVAFFGLFLLGEYGIRTQTGGGEPPGGGGVAMLLQVQVFSLAILYMASGCGIVSDDLRYRTFQLYFSKPLTRLDYALGKFTGLLLLGSTVTVIPGVLLGALRLAFYSQLDHFQHVLELTGYGLLLSFFLLCVITAIVIGLSSLTRRKGYVVLSWIGVLFVPMVVSAIVAITSGEEISALFSIPTNIYLASKILLFTEGVETVPRWAPFLILTILGGAGIAALTRRITRLEGVA
jgi:ABC-type transport system involved in multi-copper enzyme maturation permease subunit